MKVFVNDESKEISEDTTLQGLIESIEIKRKKGIAVAVDNQVIPRNHWEHFYLKEDCHIVIITATQGG